MSTEKHNFPSYAVDAQQEGSFNNENKTEISPELRAQVEAYKEKMQRFLDQNRIFFNTYAKDVSLRFKFGEGFFINMESGEINLDASWFFDRNFSEEQIRWAVLHELSHFRDLAEDSENMLNNFDYIAERGVKTGEIIAKKYEEAFGASDPDFVAKITEKRDVGKGRKMSAVDKAGYKIHHTFYNIFDDIYVNNFVARNASRFEPERGGGQEVNRLYREVLFKESDFTKAPRHLQFIYSLLRSEMVPEEVVEVSSEVQQILDTKINFENRKYTPKELVEKFLKPKKRTNTKAGNRYKIIKQTLEEIFQDLVNKDLEDWEPEKQPPQKPGPGGQGGDDPGSEEPGGDDPGGEGQGQGGPGGDPISGSKKPSNSPSQDNPQGGNAGQSSEEEDQSVNPFDDDYKDFDANSPDQLKDEEIKEWNEAHQEEQAKKREEQAKKEAEAKKSMDQKAREAQKKMDKEWCEKNEVPYKDLQIFREIERQIEPYLEELSQLWRHIVYGSSRSITRGKVGHFKTGTELDVQEAISSWPKIEGGDLEHVRVMERMESKEGLVKQPELIRIRFVGDASGSMFYEEEPVKLTVLRQVMVLLMSSLEEFNTYLNRTKSQTKSKLKVDTEAWIFGSHPLKLKPFDESSENQGSKRSMIEMLTKIQDLGGTLDDKVLGKINESIDGSDAKKIKQGKIMDIVFEVTDGGSNEPEDAKQQIRELVDKGVILAAFQIGITNSTERHIFNDVWNNSIEGQKMGQIVGASVAQLIPAVTQALKKYLQGVRL